MMTIVLGTLFAASALLALTTMIASCRGVARAAQALRSGLSAGDDVRELRYAIRETRVRATATVLRPAFTPRPMGRPVLPAAA
jgi:hypothetical protein